MRYYIIAGERSGDLHGGNLVKEIRKRDPEAELKGIGGEFMKAAGVKLSVNYSELAFMGFYEVIRNWGTVSKYTRECKKDILNYRPDVVILIDYGGFNMRMASFAKEHRFKVFYYITPKVWAWYQNRALRLKRTVDRMFVILPFEKDFFQRFDWDVDYVGNPVLDAVKAHQVNPNFLQHHKLADSGPMVALLPGSRKQELIRMAPVMAGIVKSFPHLHFGVAVVNSLEPGLYDELKVFSNVSFIEEDTYNLLLHSRAAVVTSGTATLETALLKVPQLVIYKASSATYWLVKMLIKVPFISLVNLIAGKEVIREFIQKEANPRVINEELKKLIADGSYRSTMLAGYDQILTQLDTGSASENAARLMVKYLKEDNKTA